MRKLLGLFFALAALAVSPAAADWTGKDAAGNVITFKNVNVCSSVVCVPIAQPVDSTGAAFGVTGNPLFVAPGTGQTFPISASSLPLPTGAATAANQTGGGQKSQVVDGSGNVQPSGDTAARAINIKNTDGTNTAAVKPASTAAAFSDTALVADPRPNSAATVSGASTNPTVTLTLPATTTAYTAGQLICTNSVAATCNTALASNSFAIANSAGGASIARLRLASNDTTSTAWAGQTIQVDLWTAAPTFTNGDRGTWLPATGSASHLASFVCVFPTPVWGDGLGTECGPSVGNAAGVKLGSGTAIFATFNAVTGSGVTGASKTLTLTAETLN